MEIAILLFEGFDGLDAIGPFEVFENAANAGADCRTTLPSLEGRSPITASHGLEVGVDGPLAETGPDLLVVPGGGWTDREGPGAYREAERGSIPEAIAAHRERGGSVAGVCTGGMLLARAGVLDGRPAVTHASALADLRATEAAVVDARVGDDGDVLTAGGVTSGLDLAVHLVEREFGAEVAAAVRTEMEYGPRAAVHTA
ncbi:DJ-1/PfpI family protein [Halorientalis regularis]|uniref:DJ-1/PfpI family protein n=1 Tax=Halorientalis regularis TaxID=660518 RepID=A0A1G7GMN6_9EURY|nr:DJ-1/PfpI family protein [Halorientalis regularis]SDE89407.1 DJ-1/PfpI family protein [Halorientalis regularis]